MRSCPPISASSEAVLQRTANLNALIGRILATLFLFEALLFSNAVKEFQAEVQLGQDAELSQAGYSNFCSTRLV